MMHKLIGLGVVAMTLAACSESSVVTPDAGQTTNDAAAIPDAGNPTPDSGTVTPDSGVDGGTQPADAGVPAAIEVNAEITADTTWFTGQTVTLKQHIFVTGGTLTVQPGVTVLGEAGSSLVIGQNAKLNAVGTAAQPIIFTSAQPAAQRAPGDWGGVVLLGKAPINVMGGTEKVEGFPAQETRTTYGGTDAAHDCGAIVYARIEWAGFELAPDNELNGLTLGGCGSATRVDYVQVYRGADDGVEIFGGTVNIKHIVITEADDDGLDWDFGWNGKAQFVLVTQNQAVGNGAIEADSNRNSPNAEPRSAPTIYNMSLVGSDAQPGLAGKKQFGMILRRGTAARIHNTIVTRFADVSVDVDGEPSAAQATAGNLFIRNSIFWDNANLSDTWPSETDNDMGFDEQAHFRAANWSNRFVDPQLRSTAILTPDLRPQAGSPALTGGAAPPSDGFFDATATFVGALGTEDWTAGWTTFGAPLPGPIDVNAEITTDTTWRAGQTVTLKQHIFVTGGTLTIEPGVTVLGEAGSSLVIGQNAKLSAVGNPERPIVFTSAKAPGQRAPGDWGGVVMLGRAPINVMGGTEKVEGFPAQETRTTYGGTDAAHGCGSLKYARIEWAGFELAPDNELNGLTLGGCGSATEVDYVQVYKGADDGVEIFGGTVNIKHIVITEADDDGLDWDFGWNGKAQFIVVSQNQTVGNGGIEADNNRNSPNAEPRSSPTIYNMSMIGSDADPGMAGKRQFGLILRRGTGARIYNTIVTRFADIAVDVDGEPSATQASQGNMFIRSSIFWDNANLNDTFPADIMSMGMQNDGGFDEFAWCSAEMAANRFVDPQLSSYSLGAPNYTPRRGSPALMGGATPPSDGFFDVTATFVGAVGPTNWMTGWTRFAD
jgi:hypothetical protein